MRSYGHSTENWTFKFFKILCSSLRTWSTFVFFAKMSMHLPMIYHFDVQLLGSCQIVQRTKLLPTFYHVPIYYSKAFPILLNKVASKFCFKTWPTIIIMNRIDVNL